MKELKTGVMNITDATSMMTVINVFSKAVLLMLNFIII